MIDQLGERKELRTPEWTLRYFDRGEGEPIVFLHGLGVSPLIWRNVVPSLAGSYRCIAPALPLGSHEVAMPRDADLSPRGIAALVDAFLRELDLTGVTLVGNDTGGAIAQLVAAHHPDRIGRLVLTPSDAFEHFPPPQFRVLVAMGWIPGAPWAMVQQMRSERMRYLPIAYGKLVTHRMPKEVTDAYLRPLRRREIRRDMAKVLRGVNRRDLVEAADLLGGFERPALLVWPPDDPVFLFEHATRLAGILPDARLVPIEDSRGFVSEDQPKQLAEEIGAFVGSTAAA